MLRADLDGSNIETIHAGISIQDLALDLSARKIYLTGGFGSPAIARSDLDGGQFEVVLNSGEIGGIALDPLHGKMYYTDLENGVARRNLDGSDPESLNGGMVFIGTLNVALDLAAGQFYFSSWFAHLGIWRGDIDGFGLEHWLPDDSVYSLEVLADPFCGDGKVDPGEECDDANPDPGDGCNPDCTEPVVVPATTSIALLAAAALLLGLSSVIRSRA